MIKNDMQLNITLEAIKNLKKRKLELGDINTSEYTKIEIMALMNEIERLEKSVLKYNQIKSISIIPDINSLDDISKVIIIAKIVNNKSEQEIADFLGFTIDEYNNLEENDFYGISPELLNLLANYLGVKINQEIFSNCTKEEIKLALKKLSEIGIKSDFLLNKLLINTKKLSSAIKNTSYDAPYLCSDFFNKISKYLGVEKDYLFKPDFFTSLKRELSVAYKMPLNSSDEILTIQTKYAHKLSLLIANTIKQDSNISRIDPIEIRKEIIRRYGSISFENCLLYSWDNLIPVIPLSITGGFHGACWAIGNKRIINLKQQTKMVSRWKFDFLHEFYHALTMQEDGGFVESIEADLKQYKDQDEIKANDFASYIIFGSNPDTYLRECVRIAQGKVELLKKASSVISEKYNLNLDDFSNYIAFRLKMQNIDWWGTASNLQEDKRDPLLISLNILFDRISIIDSDETLVKYIALAID